MPLRTQFPTTFITNFSDPYLLNENFDTGYGRLASTDTSLTLFIVNGEVRPVAATTNANDPNLDYAVGFANIPGRTFLTRMKRQSNFGAAITTPTVGWSPTATGNTVLVWGTANFEAVPGFATLLDLATNDSYFRIAEALRSTGSLIFINNKLAWVHTDALAATLIPRAGSRAAGKYNMALDYFRVYDHQTVFNTESFRLQAVDNPATNSDYSAVADLIADMVVTAPNPLSGSAKLIWRKQDANNYHQIYFDSSGALRANKVVAGVETEYTFLINVAASITVGATRRVRVIADGSTFNIYLQTGTSWARLVAQQADNAFSTSVTTRVEFTDYTITHYEAWPRNHALYPTVHVQQLPLVVFDGDSLTSGDGSTYDHNYPTQCVVLLGGLKLYNLQNKGSGGLTLATIAANAPTAVDPLYQSVYPKNICIIWGGTNDLKIGTAAATVYDTVVSYCQARRAAGFKVITVTLLPRSDAGTPGSFEAARQTVNTSIRNNWSTFADGLADVAADTRIGDSGDETDLTYYSGDSVHLNDTGYGVVADIVKTALGLLL